MQQLISGVLIQLELGLQLLAKKNAKGNLANQKKTCVFFFNNNNPHSLTKATRTQAIDHQITSTIA